MRAILYSFGTLAVAAIIAVMAIPIIIWNAYVLWIMWGWFIVPLGAPPISVAWAVGIAAGAHLLQASHLDTSEDGYELRTLNHSISLTKKTAAKSTLLLRMASPFLKPALILLVGYIAKGYM
jgi:hypothetical protein